MPDFKYEALDSQGKVIKGRVVAENKHQALADIRKEGLFPVAVNALDGSGKERQSLRGSVGLIAAAFAIGVVLPLLNGRIRGGFTDKGPAWIIGVPLVTGVAFALVASLMLVVELIQQIESKAKRRMTLTGFFLVFVIVGTILLIVGMETFDL